MRKLQSSIIRTQSIGRLSFSLHLFGNVYWSPAVFWAWYLGESWGTATGLSSRSLHLQLSGDILTQIHNKNNACKIGLIISTLKSAFPSGIPISVNGTSIFPVPRAPNIKLLCLLLCSHNGTQFAFQIPCHLFFLSPLFPFTPHYP